MLEPEPFAVMTHDDQPIIEGLVLTALVGVGVGVARTIGGLLFSWAMPPAAALEAAVCAQAAAMRMPNGVGIALPLPVESWTLFRLFLPATIQAGRCYLASFSRHSSCLWCGWRLDYWLMPLGAWRAARALCARCWARALVAAPAVLLLLTFIPFVAINPLLPIVWGLLILSAMQSAHNMAWQTAAWATVIAAALLLAAGALLAGSVGALLVWL